MSYEYDVACQELKARHWWSKRKLSRMNTMVEMLRALDQQIERKEDSGLYFPDRIWIPLVEHVKRAIILFRPANGRDEYGGWYFADQLLVPLEEGIRTSNMQGI